jgi:hypothetical protein
MKKNVYKIRMSLYKSLYVPVLFSIGFLVSCQSLDIAPVNILTDADIYNQGGMTAYMAGLYNRLPMEDFNTTDVGNYQGFFDWNSITWDQVSTGESVNANNTGIYIPQQGYWSAGYQIIRNTNSLIENLPAYVGKLDGAASWIAEAKFIRAYVYFTLVKRYGGVPIIDHVQGLSTSLDSLRVARSSQKDCYDFMLSDLDYAIANMPAKSDAGRANKYVAAAFKSRVALFAGSIARYGAKYNFTGADGVMLCGIPADQANSYFKQAWDAAKIVETGGYTLYQGDANLETNFANIFANADKSSESIFIRQYDFTNYVHSYDAIYSPPRMTSTYGNRFNPTLDWVELFDGLPIDQSTGHIKTTDDLGHYIVYNSPTALFANAEPRLKGSIMLQGNTYKTVELDMRSGIISESIDPATPISKFVPDDGTTTTAYTSVPWFKTNILTTTENVLTQVPFTTSTGVKLNKNGLDGPTNGGSSNTLTGFHGRKWLNMTLTPSATALHSSFQSWIDMRYAEVLLNRAEAALELSQNGDAVYATTNMQDDAYQCINKIRQRAGASLLTNVSNLSATAAYSKGTGPGSFVQAPNRGLQIVRVERYKELAFEHKIYWDLRRWFTFDTQIYNYKRRELCPFLFAKGATLDAAGSPVGKYIYDARVCERANNNLTFATKYYYAQIPTAQISVNPLLEQNNQY